MQIIGSGFLSNDGLIESQKIKLQIAPVLRLLTTTIELCQTALVNAKVDGQETAVDKQQVIACVLVARILEICESIVLLSAGGFSVEVTAGIRNFLDAYFIFGNICRDPEFLETYFNSDLSTRRKLLNVASKHKCAPFDLVREYATEKVKEQLATQISDVGASEFNSYAYANKIDCAVIYDSMYRIASAATHSTPRSLEAYVVEDEHGNVVQLRRHPQVSNIPERLNDLGIFLLNVVGGFSELFELDYRSEIETLKMSYSAV